MAQSSWRELVQQLAPHAKFAPPATSDQVAATEQALGVTLPSDLRALLAESNGIVGRHGIGLIWPVEQIKAENLVFRSNTNFQELYMPFNHLLFFGDEGGGDRYALRILAGNVEPDNVYQWIHENDSRQWFASNLRDYLGRALK
jgi:hypothetical protein